MTNYYKIDTDIPPPATGWKYPFSEMKVGHSFWVPVPDDVAAVSAATMHGKRHGERYTSRTEGNGKRIWRIE